MIALSVVCGLLFVSTAMLSVILGAQRHQLDLALMRAVPVSGRELVAVRQLGFFEAWAPGSTVALSPPERRWTYEQSYMSAFIQATLSQQIPPSGASDEQGGQPQVYALEYYMRPILALDIWFAVSLAMFIVCSAAVGGYWLSFWHWMAYVCIFSGCMGIVYGVADVAEDIKLRSILAHGRTVVGSPENANGQRARAILADAAEVDAANVLTRVKVVALCASVTGVAAFKIVTLIGDINVGRSAAGAR